MAPKKVIHKTTEEHAPTAQNHIENFIVQHGRNILIGLALFVIVAGFGSYTFIKKHTNAEADYFSAQNALYHFQNGSAKSLEKLQKTILKHPELHQKYDNVINQTLLVQKKSSLDLRQENSEYDLYSNVSILISQGKYNQALAKTLELKDMISQNEQDLPYGKDLYAFNQLRIALLNQTLEQSEGELTAMQELKNIAQSNKKILGIFSKENISLLDYIKERENVLTK
jgi:hypothetical protein